MPISLLRSEKKIADVEYKSVVLVDLCDWEGHHRVYICSIVQLFLKAGYDINVLSCSPERATEEVGSWAKVLPLSDRLLLPERLIYWSLTLRDRFMYRFKKEDFFYEWATWKLSNILQLRQSLRKANKRINRVVMLDVASMTPPIPAWLLKLLWPDCNTTGLLIQAPLTQPTRLSLLERWPSSVKILSLDERFVRFSHQCLPKCNVRYLPELVEDNDSSSSSPLAKKIQLKAQGRKIIGLYGSLSKRSNISIFFKAMRCLDPQHFYFFIVGKLYSEDAHDRELEEVIELASRNLDNFYSNTSTYLSDQDFSGLSNICDLHYLVYPKFDHSSHRLATVSCLGKPVIVSKNTLMSERVEKFDLGLSVDPDDVSANIKAISDLAYGSWTPTRNSKRWKKIHLKDIFLSRLISS